MNRLKSSEQYNLFRDEDVKRFLNASVVRDEHIYREIAKRINWILDKIGVDDTSYRRSLTAGITASTTQSQGQQALTSEINEVSTVGNANDVVTLPMASAGLECVVINNGTNTLQIFPASGDNLGAGVDTSTTLASGSNVRYIAYNTTNWESI